MELLDVMLCWIAVGEMILGTVLNDASGKVFIKTNKRRQEKFMELDRNS